MKKTINKWDVITPRQRKIGKILKISAAIVFLAIWTPIFIYTINEVIKLLIK